jgi:tetratricopeptide (TPR) repeat protein
MDAAKGTLAPAGDGPRFDAETLRNLAGQKAFARGQAYLQSGRVQILEIGPQRVLAQVAGTKGYRTELMGSGKQILGHCSCLAALAEQDFCKHMVATALAANGGAGGPGSKGADRLSRMREDIQGKSVEALVDLIVQFAWQDSSLLRKLDMPAAFLQADDAALETYLCSPVEMPGTGRGHLTRREMSNWAAGVDIVLDTIAELMSAGRAGLALRLVEQAIEWIENAGDEIIDPAGHCKALLNRMRDIHLAAVRAVRPEPVRLAGDLFDHEQLGMHETFHRAAALYADVLGDEGLAEYRRLATTEWEKLPTFTHENSELRIAFGDYAGPMGVLDYFAEQDGDFKTRIALRTKDLSAPGRYCELAEFCSAHGHDQEALRWAEEGLRIFEDDWGNRPLLLLTVELLVKAGRSVDAQAELQRAFEKTPVVELYAQLCKLGGDAARDQALKFLEARAFAETSTNWKVDQLVDALVYDKTFDAAWTAAHRYGASWAAKEALARVSEATHPREALAAYAECVDRFVSGGGDRHYARASKLIAHMAGLRSPVEQARHVAELKARFSRKRNFMKLLE